VCSVVSVIHVYQTVSGAFLINLYWLNMLRILTKQNLLLIIFFIYEIIMLI